MPNFDIILITGAPGSGKSTISKLLQEHLRSPMFEFGWIPEFRRLDIDQTYEQEEQISLENLILVSKNYIRNGYKNIILTDLTTTMVEQLSQEISRYKYIIITLIADDEILEQRLQDRTEGFKDVNKAIQSNQYWKDSAVHNQHKVEILAKSPAEIYAEVKAILYEHGN